MRQIFDHVINPANDKLVIEVVDEPGSGGASHLYAITGFDPTRNLASPPVAADGDDAVAYVLFQQGPINEAGVNGVTQEALLAIIIDRLRSFQSGPYSSRENALALTKLEEAMHWLQQRTVSRMRRGVEGSHKV